jgi:hypothetical protein
MVSQVAFTCIFFIFFKLDINRISSVIIASTSVPICDGLKKTFWVRGACCNLAAFKGFLHPDIASRHTGFSPEKFNQARCDKRRYCDTAANGVGVDCSVSPCNSTDGSDSESCDSLDEAAVWSSTVSPIENNCTKCESFL